MAIIVDTTNIVQAGFDLNSISITLLRELARERSHRLIVTDVVVEELRAKKLEQVGADIQAYETAASRVRRFHPLDLVHLPEAEHVTNLWVSLLEATFEVEATSGDEARNALFREVVGRAPSEKKRGARDASIWEVVKRLHLGDDGDTYFVSHNRKDFAEPKEGVRLHPALEEELGDSSARFHFLQNIDDVLEAMGTRTADKLTVLDLDDHSAALGAVLGWVQLHPGPKAFSSWATLGASQPPSAIVVSPKIEALPVAVESSEAYEVEKRRVMVARTRWQLAYEIVAIPGEDDVSSFHLAGDVRITLLLRDLEDGSQAAEVVQGEDLSLTVFRTLG